MRETFTSGSTRGEWVTPLAESPSLLLYRLGIATSGHIFINAKHIKAAEERKRRVPPRYPLQRALV